MSRITVLAYLRLYGISLRKQDVLQMRKGQVPFGRQMLERKIVKDTIEQEIVRMMRRYLSTGESFRGIARDLSRKLIPTKNNGIWQANTVRKILKRVEDQSPRVTV